MTIYAILPVKVLRNSKSRLSNMLSPSERVELSSIMLRQTLGVLSSCKELTRTIVVSSDRAVKQICHSFGPRCEYVQEESDTGVNSAVALANESSLHSGAAATIVIPQDLPLLTEADISMVVEAGGSEASVVICPSQRLDGTNVLFRRPPNIIGTSYDNESFFNHVRLATAKGVEPRIIHTFALAHDVDTESDISELVKSYDIGKNPVLDFLKDRLYAAKSSTPWHTSRER